MPTRSFIRVTQVNLDDTKAYLQGLYNTVHLYRFHIPTDLYIVLL